MVDEHRKIRFSDGAAAIEATPKAFRKMLDNPQLATIGSSDAVDDGGWHDFTLLQIAGFAITRRLVDYGSSVGVASIRACKALLDLYSRMLTEQNFDDDFVSRDGFTLGAFLDHISGSHLVISPDDKGEQEVLTPVMLKKRYPSWSLDRPMLIIPIGPVVNRALARALLGQGIDSSGNERSALMPFSKVRLSIGSVVLKDDPVPPAGKTEKQARKAKATPKKRKAR